MDFAASLIEATGVSALRDSQYPPRMENATLMAINTMIYRLKRFSSSCKVHSKPVTSSQPQSSLLLSMMG